MTSRVERDIEQYGFSYEKAVTVFLNSNLKEFVQYGAESKNWSDITCYCHNDYEIDLTAVSEELFPLLQSLTSHLNLISMEGMIVPVLTPFTEKNTVDQQSFIRHLEWLYMNGAKKILVGGTTGEFFSLTIEERVRICSLACRYFPGAILFQIGCDGIGNTITLLEKSLRYGKDGVFLSAPVFITATLLSRDLSNIFSLIASKMHRSTVSV